MDSTQTMGQQPPTQVPQTNPSMTTPSPMVSSGVNKNIGIIVGIVVAVVVLGAGGVWAWLTYGMKPSPEKVMDRMYEASKTINSSSETGTVTVEVNDPATAPKPITIKLALNGAGSGQTLKDAKGHATVDVTATTPYGDLMASLEERVVDGVFYYQVTKLPIEIGAMFGTDIQNKWASVSLDELKAYVEEQKNMPGVSDADKKSAETFLSVLSGESTQNKAQIIDLIHKYNLLTVKSSLPSENLDGQEMYHYALDINKANVYPFLKDYISQVSPDAFKSMSQDDMNQAEKNVNDFVQATQMSAEVWIGSKDYYPHRLVFNGFIDGTSEAGKSLLDSDKASLKISGDISMKDFNAAVDVAKPDGAQSLIQLIKQLNQPAQIDSTSTDANTDTEKDTDGDGIPDFMEKSFYNTDPNNPDTDGDGYKDGQEVEQGYNPNGPGKLYQ